MREPLHLTNNFTKNTRLSSKPIIQATAKEEIIIHTVLNNFRPTKQDKNINATRSTKRKNKTNPYQCSVSRRNVTRILRSDTKINNSVKQAKFIMHQTS